MACPTPPFSHSLVSLSCSSRAFLIPHYLRCLCVSVGADLVVPSGEMHCSSTLFSSVPPLRSSRPLELLAPCDAPSRALTLVLQP